MLYQGPAESKFAQKDLACMARIFVYQFLQDFEDLDTTTSKKVNKCFNGRQLPSLHKPPTKNMLPAELVGRRQLIPREVLANEGSSPAGSPQSAEGPVVVLQAAEDRTGKAPRNPGREYCGSYTGLVNALYSFIKVHYTLNIYNDEKMNEFIQSMCHLYSM